MPTPKGRWIRRMNDAKIMRSSAGDRAQVRRHAGVVVTMQGLAFCWIRTTSMSLHSLWELIAVI
jgi:hypothetical protein